MNDDLQRFFLSKNLVINSVISHGAYGEVYNVFSTQYNRTFAMKKIPISKFNEMEINCLKAIDDTRIVSLYDYYVYDGCAYMLMEYCPNDLEKMIRMSTKFSPNDLQRLVYEVTACVKACHNRNIAHCDIKPANFMFDTYGRLKIGDFGLSLIMQQDQKIKYAKGTKLFMSPEILNNSVHDPFKADIWALGVTIYYIATSALPFYARDNGLLSEKIARGVYLDELVDDIVLRKIISACLEIDPLKRPTIDELLKLPYFTHYQMASSSKLTHKLLMKRSIMSNPCFRLKHKSISVIHKDAPLIIPNLNCN